MSAYSSAANAASSEKRNSPKTPYKKAENTSSFSNPDNAETLVKAIKVVNTLNAVLIGAAGVLAFMLESLTLLVVLSALYVICFSVLLFCFECHFQVFDVAINANFGFMFKWHGRAIFLLFCGTLCFGLGVMGIVTGSITCVNVIFNSYILCKNKSYREALNKEQKDLQKRVGINVQTPDIPVASSNVQSSSSASAPASGSSSAHSAPGSAYPSSGDSNPFAVDVAVSAGGKTVNVPVNVNISKPEWEKLFDEGSGKYYYYNHKTKESRWEEEFQP